MVEEVEKRYKQICHTLQEMLDWEYSVKETQYLMQMEENNKSSLQKGRVDHLGADSVDVSNSYRILMEAYQLGNNLHDKELEVFSGKLNDVYRQKSIINGCVNLEKPSAMEQLRESIVKNLENDHCAYLGYANKFPGVGHANMIKYSLEENGQWSRVFYNAGGDVNEDNTKILDSGYQGNINLKEGVIYPALKTTFENKGALIDQIRQDISDTFEFIELSEEQEISKLRDRIDLHKQSLPKAIPASEKTLVRAQNVGNCTTRSITEAARDNMADSTFREFLIFAINTKYSEMLEILEYQKKALEKEKNIKPLRIKNFNKFDSSAGDKEASYSQIFAAEINNRLGLPMNRNVLNDSLIDSFDDKPLNEKVFLAKNNARHWLQNDLIDVMENKQAKISAIAIPCDVAIDRGFDALSKTILVEDYANNFAYEEVEKIWKDNFSKVIQEPDHPLTRNLLDVPRNILNEVFEEKYEEASKDSFFQEVESEWQMKCCASSKVDPVIKAAIGSYVLDIKYSDMYNKIARDAKYEDIAAIVGKKLYLVTDKDGKQVKGHVKQKPKDKIKEMLNHMIERKLSSADKQAIDSVKEVLKSETNRPTPVPKVRDDKSRSRG